MDGSIDSYFGLWLITHYYHYFDAEIALNLAVGSWLLCPLDMFHFLDFGTTCWGRFILSFPCTHL